MQAVVKEQAARVNHPVLLEVPGIDMYAEDGILFTKVPLPEFKENEIEVTATAEGLDISAVRSDKTREIDGGRQSYWRHLSLPRESNPEEMKMEFRGGQLTITIPVSSALRTAGKNLIKRKEAGHDLREDTSQAKRAGALGFRNQEFPNHWTRYRPVR